MHFVENTEIVFRECFCLRQLGVGEEVSIFKRNAVLVGNSPHLLKDVGRGRADCEALVGIVLNKLHDEIALSGACRLDRSYPLFGLKKTHHVRISLTVVFMQQHSLTFSVFRVD